MGDGHYKSGRIGGLKFQKGAYTNWRLGGAGEEEDTGDFHIIIEAVHCIPLHPKPTGCPPSSDSSAGCALFSKVLAIEDECKTPPVNETEPCKDFKYSLTDKLSWKKEVLDTSSEIFSKICEPFPPEMPFTVSRVFEYFLKVAHDATPSPSDDIKNPMWDHLMSELERCNAAIKEPMLWYWDNKDGNHKCAK